LLDGLGSADHGAAGSRPVSSSGRRLVIASWVVLVVELRLFRPIDRQYVRAQDSVLGAPVRKAVKRARMFERVVFLYPGVLLLLTIAVGCYVWVRGSGT
jgi:hypothetical protein